VDGNGFGIDEGRGPANQIHLAGFFQVRDNAVTGGGRLQYGLAAGDARCSPSRGVGLNSTCSGNGIQ